MRGLRHPRVSWLVPLAVIIAGCAGGATPTPAEAAFFPQHSTPMGAGYEAALEGPLVFADGCLFVEASPGERILIVWPSDTTLGKINDLPAVLGTDSELLLETGTTVRLGGRSVDAETAEELAGMKVPRACAGGGFWVVSTIDEALGSVQRRGSQG